MATIEELKKIQSELIAHPLSGRSMNSANLGDEARLYDISIELGWSLIIQQLYHTIESLPPELWPTIRQIKEKFGGLRVYYTYVVPAETDLDVASEAAQLVSDAVSYAQGQADHTCQYCGRRGRLRIENWRSVLCDYHHKHRHGPESELPSPAKEDPTPAYYAIEQNRDPVPAGIDRGPGDDYETVLVITDLYTKQDVTISHPNKAYLKGFYESTYILTTDPVRFAEVAGCLSAPYEKMLALFADENHVDITADLVQLGDKPDGKSVSKVWRKTQGLKA